MDRMKILIVDDEPSILYTMKSLLANYDIIDFTDSAKAFESLCKGDTYDILIIDYRLQALSGLDLLSEAKARLKKYRAILMTAYSTREMLERGMNEDLFYKLLKKPLQSSQILNVIEQAQKGLREEDDKEKHIAQLEQQLAHFIAQSSSGKADHVYVHVSEMMKDLLSNAKKYAASNANIIILGENGSGKEVLSNYLHKNSKRADKPMIRINCAAIPESLFESELFGHEKGSFTGASEAKPGKFQLADGGTIFLDEISELPNSLQPKLLRVIGNKEIMPIGAKFAKTVDVRIISATNRNLHEMIESNRFRVDLFHRLNTLTIRIPPLRERREDIPILASYFLNKVTIEEGGPCKIFDMEAIIALTKLEFQGNIRELKNLVHRLYLISEGTNITAAHIERACNSEIAKIDDLFEKSRSLTEFKILAEKRYVRRQLELNQFNITKTAEKLNMPKGNLSRKIKELGIDIKEKE